MRQPDINYAKVGDSYVAYTVAGNGPVDLVCTMGLGGHVEHVWDYPPMARYLESLTGFSRLIMFDRRGLGGSDPVPANAPPSWEQWMEDLLAVMDAAGSKRAAIYAELDGGPVGMLFAGHYPERTSALILANTAAKYVASEDYPQGEPPETWDGLADIIEKLWGRDELSPISVPSLADDERYVKWSSRMARAVATPGVAAALFKYTFGLDVRSVLSSIQCPTLVLHRADYKFVNVSHGRYLADHIPGARMVELPGSDLWFFTPGSGHVSGMIEEFVTGVPPVPGRDRVLATVLFTDVVGSTEKLAVLGDRPYNELLEAHDEIMRREVDRFGGRVIGASGDETFATFDGPGRAIRCARSAGDALRALGLDIRAGIHTGEIEKRGDDVGGIAVHIGSRVMSEAGPGEVLCTRTVKDLVAGAGFSFDDRGTHALKGVPDEWQLFAVDDQARVHAA
jgi:class 3 adenylate cyclase/pimeloyl-ACP methyl ester carboxylesterase